MYNVAVAVELAFGLPVLFEPVFPLFVLFVEFVEFEGVAFTRADKSFGLPLSNGLSPWGELIAYTWKV
jgi:hypothetical protein